ncbi:Virulence-associated protein E (plasmid) [Corynebacterium mustelae]|uniref:Virulence-associated protein E n=1 Tax=Corynebacterium mustelae TaxID=571915 RepID=A0A0G3H8F4_9CORY|nr:virulence-associated E family protein [Corynebacterium mustelae]AKK05222.1 Virulence-associated protein E [Corynebacterium mustelae]AKK07452.1 Virulence-associated protein E [Corynebacterium mustelae]
MTTPSREIKLATAPTRLARRWENTLTTWPHLKQRLQTPSISQTTVEKYHALPKAQQADLKDHGGFVGGHLQHGRRKKDAVLSRSILCLDIDDPPQNLLTTLPDTLTCEWVAYSTHSHTPTNPRLRLILPLTRDVTADEYEAIGRRIAQDIGIDFFDDTTYQAHRLMYWPSKCVDGEYLYQENHGTWLDPDKTLNRFDDWRDVTTWPVSSRQANIIKHTADRQADPLEKPGIVGAFCRAFTIHEAITEFLENTYATSTIPDRYTYTPGESANGVITYDNKFAYSHHGTDPAGGQLCNAFDLVRIHLYGGEDDDTNPNTPPAAKPSYQSMVRLATNHPVVKQALATERIQQAQQEFDGLDVDTPTEAGEWESLLELNKNGKVIDVLSNYVTILTHEKTLQGIALNELTGGVDIHPGKPTPWAQTKPGWSDTDNAHLRVLLQKRWGLYHVGKTKDALAAVSAQRSFHPVRDYLDQLPAWDGVKRVDRLFVDYLGADDTEYVRAVTRKTLVAAVARVRTPGVKFDQVLILNGPQGVGKSTIFARLAGQWFSDALTLLDMKDKTGAEKLQGYWILELGELAGMRKMEVETVKGFLSRTDDKYRAAYGTVVESHPRQCIIVGSTNAENGFLRDNTGNRRFWPVTVTDHATKKAWSMTDAEVDQIWAEAHHYYQQGEPLYLTGTLAHIATRQQESAIETDDRAGLVEAWLDIPLADNWENLTLTQRRQWFQTMDDFGHVDDYTGALVRRETVTNPEIWAECWGQDPSRLRPADSYAIAAIMQKMPGWEKQGSKRKTKLYGQQRAYKRCDEPEDQPPF